MALELFRKYLHKEEKLEPLNSVLEKPDGFIPDVIWIWVLILDRFEYNDSNGSISFGWKLPG